MVVNTNNAGSKRARPIRNGEEMLRRCSWFKRECRRRRLRVTVQRLAVYRALAADATHPTADAIYARLRTGLTGLSMATVYRILDSLEREGFVHRVGSTDGVGRFDANLTRHQHLVCRICGSITDLDDEVLAGMKLPRRGLAQFFPEALDISVIGICGRCRKPEGRRAASKRMMTESAARRATT